LFTSPIIIENRGIKYKTMTCWTNIKWRQISEKKIKGDTHRIYTNRTTMLYLNNSSGGSRFQLSSLLNIPEKSHEVNKLTRKSCALRCQPFLQYKWMGLVEATWKDWTRTCTFIKCPLYTSRKKLYQSNIVNNY